MVQVRLATFDGVVVGDMVALRTYPYSRYMVMEKSFALVHLARIVDGGQSGTPTIVDRAQFDAMALRVTTLGGD